jgi:hypothetical protein
METDAKDVKGKGARRDAKRNPRITYSPHPDATPEGELAALAAVYQYLLDHHEKNAIKVGDDKGTAEPERAGGPSRKRPARDGSSRSRKRRYKTVDFYLLTTAQSSDVEEPSSADYPFYGDHILPVRTSPESLARAMKAFASSWQGVDYIGFEVTDPFELAEMIGFFKEHGLKTLLFDPPPAPDGNLWILGDPIPVDDYRRAIEEIRPQFENLDAEALEEFCRPSHLTKEPFVRWPAARAEDIAADLRARMEELTAANGS